EVSPHKFYRIKKMAWLPHKSGLIISGAKTNGVDLWRLSFSDMELRQVAESLASYFDLGITDDGSQVVASQAARISELWVGTNRNPQTLKRTTQAIDGFCWTPDGRLVYQSSAAGTSDLWITQPDGSGQKQLTVNAGANAAPTMAPGGHYIAFTSSRTGVFQVWRMNLDGSDQVQLTNGAGASYPAISTDGKWVLYNSTDDWHLWKVPIGGGGAGAPTPYLPLLRSGSPGGRTISCLGRNESRSQLLVMPIEGGQPSKRMNLAEGTFTGYRVKWAADGKSLFYAAIHNLATAIIRQPLDGGPSEQMARFDEDELFDFDYS